MSSQHIVKSFDSELKRLDEAIAEMGGLAEALLADAVEALVQRDADRALKAMAADAKIDELEDTIDRLAVQILALRQPMAADLRAVIVALKTSGILERIGDYAKNIAKRTGVLVQSPPMSAVNTVARMAKLVQAMIKSALDAYLTRDAVIAEDVRSRDAEVDALHTSLFRELLTYMMEDPRNITPCAHLLFIAKNIERIGDHATNIAENVLFLVTGAEPTEARLKDDMSSFTAVDHKAGDIP
jgi:phosphate transport system protein